MVGKSQLPTKQTILIVHRPAGTSRIYFWQRYCSGMYIARSGFTVPNVFRETQTQALIAKKAKEDLFMQNLRSCVISLCSCVVLVRHSVCFLGLRSLQGWK